MKDLLLNDKSLYNIDTLDKGKTINVISRRSQKPD